MNIEKTILDKRDYKAIIIYIPLGKFDVKSEAYFSVIPSVYIPKKLSRILNNLHSIVACKGIMRKVYIKVL